MRVWETGAAGAGALRALAAKASGRVERLERDDGAGGMVLCERGAAPDGVGERRFTALFSGGRHGPKAGDWVFRVGLWTPEDWAMELRAWYEYEHAPILLECPVWNGFRFFQTPAERGCQFYVFHYLQERAALDSRERKLSRSTPWFRRLARNDWFDGAFERVLCKRC